MITYNEFLNEAAASLPSRVQVFSKKYKLDPLVPKYVFFSKDDDDLNNSCNIAYDVVDKLFEIRMKQKYFNSDTWKTNYENQAYVIAKLGTINRIVLQSKDNVFELRWAIKPENNMEWDSAELRELFIDYINTKKLSLSNGSLVALNISSNQLTARKYNL